MLVWSKIHCATSIALKFIKDSGWSLSNAVWQLLAINLFVQMSFPGCWALFVKFESIVDGDFAFQVLLLWAAKGVKLTKQSLLSLNKSLSAYQLGKVFGFSLSLNQALGKIWCNSIFIWKCYYKYKI